MSEQSFLKKHLVVTMLLGALLVAFGIVMLTSKGKLFIILMGFGLILSGLTTLDAIVSLRKELKGSAVTFSGNIRTIAIIKSLLSIVLGVLGIIYSQEGVKVLMYVMGVQMAVSAIIGLYDAIIVKRDIGLPVSSLVTDAVFSLIIAVVLFVFPSGAGQAIATVIAVILIIAGISLFFWAFRIRKIDKEFISPKAEVIDEQ
jgi:uncharacterized membrane protein HdeD (DUF308 family)